MVTERLSAEHTANNSELLELVATYATVVTDHPLKEPVSNDPDDDKFIAAALHSNAKIICSGDKHLLDVNGYKGLEIIRPKPFADKYLTRLRSRECDKIIKTE